MQCATSGHSTLPLPTSRAAWGVAWEAFSGILLKEMPFTLVSRAIRVRQAGVLGSFHPYKLYSTRRAEQHTSRADRLGEADGSALPGNKLPSSAGRRAKSIP